MYISKPFVLLWFMFVDSRQEKESENVMKNVLINKLKRTHATNQITSDDLKFNEAIYEAVMANWMLKNAIR